MSLLRWLKEVRAGGDPPRKETVMDNESKIRAMLAAASNSLLARVLEDTLNKKELDVIFPWLGAEIRENRVDVFARANAKCKADWDEWEAAHGICGKAMTEDDILAIYDTMSDEELDTAPKGTWPYVVKELRAS